MIIRRASAQQTGREAEQLARTYLERQQRMRLLHQNWSCRRGELDLVMLDGDTVVFVEIRSRRYQAWGGALESVDARKRQRLIAAAEHFLQREARWSRHPCRFDVIAVQLPAGDTPAQLNWIPNAFDT